MRLCLTAYVPDWAGKEAERGNAWPMLLLHLYAVLTYPRAKSMRAVSVKWEGTEVYSPMRGLRALANNCKSFCLLCSHRETGKQNSTYRGWCLAWVKFAHWRVVGAFSILGLWKTAKLIFASRPDRLCNEETRSMQTCSHRLFLGGIQF